MLCKDIDIVVRVVKVLKFLVILGLKYLKVEFFCMVVFLCMLCCDGIFIDEVVELLRKIRVRIWIGIFMLEWFG